MGSTHLGRWVGGGLDEYGRPVFDGMDLHGYWAEEEAGRTIQVPCATGSGSGLAPAIVVGAAISGTVAQGAGAAPGRCPGDGGGARRARGARPSADGADAGATAGRAGGAA